MKYCQSLNKLSCELAYVGTLFWLPLVTCPNNKNARFCANQGLWVLIAATIACTCVQVFENVNNFFTGALGIVWGGIYSLIFMLFLGFMMYLLCQGVKNAMMIHRDEEPQSILFFDRVRIIKY